MRKQKSYILPPLESKKLLAIDRQVQKDIKEQHHALECVRSEMSFIVALKYQSQIKSFQHSRTANRPRASQSLYEPIPQQQIEQQQTGINFLGTVKRRFLKSHIEPQSVELLKFYEEEDYYELREYFKQHPIDQFIQGITLLYRAVKDENLKMIQFCLSKGADMNLIQEVFLSKQFEEMAISKNDSVPIGKIDEQLGSNTFNAYMIIYVQLYSHLYLQNLYIFCIFISFSSSQDFIFSSFSFSFPLYSELHTHNKLWCRLTKFLKLLAPGFCFQVPMQFYYQVYKQIYLVIQCLLLRLKQVTQFHWLTLGRPNYKIIH